MPIKDFILASSSPQRKALLSQIGYEAKAVISADIDEREHKGEKPSAYVKRMAKEKALKVYSENPGEVVLGADTIVCVGRRLLHKAQKKKKKKKVIEQLSGRSHHVLSAVCVVDRKGIPSVKFIDTRVKMKKMSAEEILHYVSSQEWQGCSGYKIEGIMEAYVSKIIGSYSGIIGLPLCEAKKLLNGVGIK